MGPYCWVCTDVSWWEAASLDSEAPEAGSALAFLAPGASVEPPQRCGNASPLLHQDLAPALARNEVG